MFAKVILADRPAQARTPSNFVLINLGGTHHATNNHNQPTTKYADICPVVYQLLSA
jgi:hypothetical protein